MESFSERENYKEVRKEFQNESMDNDLRIGLWNIFYLSYLEHLSTHQYWKSSVYVEPLIKNLWVGFNQPVNLIPAFSSDVVKYLHSSFLKSTWNIIFDIIELAGNYHVNKATSTSFKEACNNVLAKEMSAWRFIGNKIARITSEEEISTIESAANLPKPYSPVSAHTRQALDHLSDRKNPDYRNSIKESIGAVEAVCKIITGKENATLGKALTFLEQNGVEIHP